MGNLIKNDLFSLEWFARSSFAGIEAALHKRLTTDRHEASLIRNLVLDLLDSERADADFRLSPILSFYAFCQPLVRRSHAQILQDLWVLYMLGSPRGGYFVEFGACDGRSLSNTRLLEEDYGWTGILAEPNPVWHDALQANRRAVIDRRCVAAHSDETVDFLSTDAMPELSRMADIIPDDVHERNGNRDRQTLYRVQTVSLNDLLDQHGAPDVVDYLSVDTEGSEYEILRHADLTRRRFRLISVEHAGEAAKRDQILALLEGAGYRRWMPELSRWDDWYVHQDDLGRSGASWRTKPAGKNVASAWRTGMSPEKTVELADKFDLPFHQINYLINVDAARKIVYLETPKVACTSIKKYMIDQASGGAVEMKPNEVHDRQKSPLKALGDYSDAEVDAILGARSDFRRFCFVRNPYSRVLSAYLDKIVGNEWERERHLPMFGFEQGSRPEFVEFLRRLAMISDRDRDIHYITQTRLTGRLSGFSPDFIGRFEDFAQDFHFLKSCFYADEGTEDCQSFGKHHSSDADEKITLFYGEEERKIVREIYAADFAMFGYVV